MAKASFSRRPTPYKVKLAGTLTIRGGSEATEGDAQEVLDAVVEALDGTSFEVETLDADVR